MEFELPGMVSMVLTESHSVAFDNYRMNRHVGTLAIDLDDRHFPNPNLRPILN